MKKDFWAYVNPFNHWPVVQVLYIAVIWAMIFERSFFGTIAGTIVILTVIFIPYVLYTLVVQVVPFKYWCDNSTVRTAFLYAISLLFFFNQSYGIYLNAGTKYIGDIGLVIDGNVTAYGYARVLLYCFVFVLITEIVLIRRGGICGKR